jgi:hypothetical protein
MRVLYDFGSQNECARFLEGIENFPGAIRFSSFSNPVEVAY